MPRSAHNATTRPRARSTEIETANRSFIGLATGDRPQIERLLGHELSLEDVAAGEPKACFDVGRGEHLAGDDRVGDIRRILCETFDHVIRNLVSPLIPCAFRKLVRE